MAFMALEALIPEAGAAAAAEGGAAAGAAGAAEGGAAAAGGMASKAAQFGGNALNKAAARFAQHTVPNGPTANPGQMQKPLAQRFANNPQLNGSQNENRQQQQQGRPNRLNEASANYSAVLQGGQFNR